MSENIRYKKSMRETNIFQLVYLLSHVWGVASKTITNFCNAIYFLWQIKKPDLISKIIDASKVSVSLYSQMESRGFCRGPPWHHICACQQWPGSQDSVSFSLIWSEVTWCHHLGILADWWVPGWTTLGVYWLN